MLSIDQISFKSTDCVIYDIECFKNLNSKNSSHLVFDNVDAYIEENNEDNEEKYLMFALTEKNNETLENYTELWDEIKDQIELTSGNEPIEYEKTFMKIRFESDDDLPNIPVCVIIIRSVFQENNKYYPQAFLHECFYEYEFEYEDDFCVIA